ncbi:MAG: hypothetical protein U1E83_10905 [Methylotetracoccus sp.]
MTKQRVYLDKCFWVSLRDVHLKRSLNPTTRHLLDTLLEAVSNEKIVCPLSASLFVELMRQSDPFTRNATAKLMDMLSGGLSFIPHKDRVSTEMAHFLHQRAGYTVHPVEVLVWTKAPYVLGMQHPIGRLFAPEDQTMIQKAFFDHMSSISLEEMVTTIGDSWFPDTPFGAAADRINQANKLHSDELKSFEATFRAELLGIVDLCTSTARDVLTKMSADGRAAAGVELASDGSLRAFLKALAFEPGAPTGLRTLHISASLHAAVRWNRGKKLSANDLLDFQHAETAIAYCDVFLTDGPLRSLLTQKNLGLSKSFPCRISSTAEEAIAWLP